MGPGQPRPGPQLLRQVKKIGSSDSQLEMHLARPSSRLSQRTVTKRRSQRSRRCSSAGSWVCAGCPATSGPLRYERRASGASSPSKRCAINASANATRAMCFGACSCRRRDHPHERTIMACARSIHLEAQSCPFVDAVSRVVSPISHWPSWVWPLS
jgi:hypothetical protein